MKKYLLPLFIALSTPAYAHIDCLTSDVNDIYLMPSQSATVSSHHKIIITNDMAYAASYRYTLQLCADEQGCEVRNKVITLNPGQTFNFQTQVKIDLHYGKPGLRTITASTFVIGTEKGEISKTSIIYVRV